MCARDAPTSRPPCRTGLRAPRGSAAGSTLRRRARCRPEIQAFENKAFLILTRTVLVRMREMTAVLQVEGLTAAYGTHEAVRGLSFALERGAIGCLLGPSG